MEKSNRELEYKIELYQKQIRLQQEKIQREQAKCEKLAKELQQTRDNLDKIKKQFEERVSQLSFELEMLENFSRQTSCTLSYEELFPSVLEHLKHLIPCDLRAIIIIENSNCNIYLETSRFLSATVKEEIKQQLLTSSIEITRSAANHQYCLDLNHLNREKITAKEGPIETIGSQLLVPMIAKPEEKKQIIGLLFLADEKETYFSQDSIRRLEAIAQRAAILIQQLRVLLAAKRSRIENEKIRANLAKERQLNNLKLRFVRTISHEYRTPLTVISLASDLLEKQSDRLSEEQRNSCWKRIRNGIQHMYNLAEDVLLLERVETEDIELEPVRLDLVVFCYQLVEDLQLLAERQQTIEFSYQGDRVEVYLDKKLLRQILSNLLSNALKYSPQESKIDFELTFADDRVIFQIRDRGMGIPPEELPRLFEPFHRADNVGNLPGTGLGLAIVKKSVDLQRGEISVESELGIGSTFTVKLPFKKAES